MRIGRCGEITLEVTEMSGNEVLKVEAGGLKDEDLYPCTNWGYTRGYTRAELWDARGKGSIYDSNY